LNAVIDLNLKGKRHEMKNNIEKIVFHG